MFGAVAARGVVALSVAMDGVKAANETKLRFYFQGAQSLLIHCADEALSLGHEILGVITKAPQIVEWAERVGVPVVAPGADVAERVTEPFDWFLSVGNLSMVSETVLGKAKHGGINFHDGPLPRYAGLNATAWALMHREATHGITWHLMTSGVDEGDIVAQRVFDVAADETSFSLNTKCYEAAIESFSVMLGDLSKDRLQRKPQPKDGRSYFGRVDRPAGAATLDWRKPAAELAALVRALDFGPVENPLAQAKLRTNRGVLSASKAKHSKSPAGATSERTAGTIVSASDTELVVACGEGTIALSGITDLYGATADLEGLALDPLDDRHLQRLTEVHRQVAKREGAWRRRLELAQPTAFDAPQGERTATKTLDVSATVDELVAALMIVEARTQHRASGLTVGYCDATTADLVAGVSDDFAPIVPLVGELQDAIGIGEVVQVAAEARAASTKDGTFARDIFLRYPSLASRAHELARVDAITVVPGDANVEAPITVHVGDAITWRYPSAAEADIARLSEQVEGLLAALRADPAQPWRAASMLSDETLKRVLEEWNDTAREYDRAACLHQLFEAQAARTPHATALVDGNKEIAYAELDRRSNRLARQLAGHGVGPDVLVGVCVDRSADMVVATLGVMKAGGAYVPMDPAYPAERIALMLEDSGVQVVITNTERDTGAAVAIRVDHDEGADSSSPNVAVTSSNLAYAIYTSGSTGRPKAVMLEHRNVVNFFAGMDERLGWSEGDAPGVWLAVTSLSFDISVLELFWTLTRGFTVVLHGDKAHAGPARPNASKPITFSLMYFASDEGEHAEDKYRLLLEGAKFGDTNGFSAVWTPERHFHAFGGLYPNPSVAAAALSTITERIHLRAASVVMPLHHPVRVAEEWALVDNLSRGRVGIAFASGWQPNDFIIRHPERFEDRKQVMLESIDSVRKLWRGETMKATSPLGEEIEVRTLPRPVQAELPFWVTAAGNPETFRAAGKIGANVLTHLLGQTVDEVAEKIRIYREARQEAGHAGPGEVTLMLHTFVGPDEAVVRETVRGPMKDYLKSAVALVKAAAWTFPTFKQKADAAGKTPQEMFEEEELSPEDLDALLEHAFGRYYETSGLFGTPEHCIDMVDRLKGIGVDDIGCLLDYRVPSETVMAHLPYLLQVKEGAAPVDTSDGVAARIERHAVTHMQCTPSQMSLIVADDADRAALRGLKKVMVGGEAFPAALAQRVSMSTDGDVLNMYGPTETTIWSTTSGVPGDGAGVPIGRPMANTQVYLLDETKLPVPVGAAGELYIGGDGVARGYYQRPELTDERFGPNPFRDGERMYRTGDLARYREDGVIEFLGRVDHQVKLRGYRIELGEIEAHLARHEAVRDAVVIAREDTPGDKRLVGYVVTNANATVDLDALRESVAGHLPEHMVPSRLVALDELPLTPNAKVDRKALPAPDQLVARTAAYVAPSGGLERAIADIWGKLLHVEKIGLEDNFFDLGGHSLLAVQAHREVAALVEQKLSLTDLFRFPTVRSLVAHLERDDSQAKEENKARAATRKAGLARRAQLRNRRRS